MPHQASPIPGPENLSIEQSPVERWTRHSLVVYRLLQMLPLPMRLSRRMLHQAVAGVKLGANMRRDSVSAAGVTCEWLIPSGSPKDRVLLYLHGGGFVHGLTPQHMTMVAFLARRMGTRTLMVDYRLAPEHSFPAALDDCLKTYRWLLEQGFEADKVVLAGDSAGGNLALAMLMLLRDSGEPLPAAAACLSPVIDLTDRGTPDKKFKDPLIPAKAGKFYHQAYLGGCDAHDPRISPAYGNWHGLPPLLIHAGEDEQLRQDALRAADLAKAAGVDARLVIHPRMWHVFQLYPRLPQTSRSLEDIAAFLKMHLRNAEPTEAS